MIYDLLGYDTETTSKEPSTARVVQAAALLRKSDGELFTVMNQLCNPGCDISEEAQKIHGISQAMVADAEPDADALKRLYGYISEYRDCIIIVGHNLIYDLTIMWNLCGPKIPVLYIDTFVAATRVFPDADSHKLGDLIEWLELGNFGEAHDAEVDIKMVFALVDYIFNGMRKADLNKQNWTHKDFALWCMTPRVLKRAHFGKHMGKLWGKPAPGESPKKYVPAGYVKFICGKWTDPSPDMVETIWQKYRMRFRRRRKT